MSLFSPLAHPEPAAANPVPPLESLKRSLENGERGTGTHSVSEIVAISLESRESDPAARAIGRNK